MRALISFKYLTFFVNFAVTVGINELILVRNFSMPVNI